MATRRVLHDVDGAPGWAVGRYYRRWRAFREGRPVAPQPMYTTPAGRFRLKGLAWRTDLAVPCGVELPGFPRYRLDRRPDGEWGIRSYTRTGPLLPGDFLHPRPHVYDQRPTYNLVAEWGESFSRQLAWWVLLSVDGWPEDGFDYACHRDGDPGHNELPNLYWGSPGQNALDRERHRRQREQAAAVDWADFDSELMEAA